jgi:hypothetical protein
VVWKVVAVRKERVIMLNGTVCFSRILTGKKERIRTGDACGSGGNPGNRQVFPQ